MKTIFIINTSKTHCGVDDYCLCLYAMFKNEMRFVFFVVPDSDFSRILQKKKLNTIFLKKGYYRNLKIMKKALNQEKPDIVHIQTAKDYYLVLASHKKANTIFTRHNSSHLNYPANFFLLKRADAIIALSKFSKQAFLSRFSSLSHKVALIYNTIPDASETNPKLENRGRDIQAIRFGFMGRINKRKGLDHLVEALSILRDELGQEKFILDIAGNFEDQEYELSLQAAIVRHSLETSIHFLGFIQNKEQFYNKIDVLIIPSLLSLKETCPLVAFEAMSHGLPLVSFESGAMPEIIEHGLTGFICENESPGKMAHALASFCTSANLLENMGRNAFQRYLTLFSPPIFKNKMSEIYQT